MDLPEVTQRFDADTIPYITGIEAAISATNDLRAAVEELSAAIDAIPDKTIDINDGSVKDALITVEALSAAIRDIPDKTVNVHVDQQGGAGAAGAAANTAATEAATKAAEDNAAAVDREAAADQNLNNVLKNLGGGFQELDALLGQTSAGERAAAASADEAANALHGEGAAARDAAAATSTASAAERDYSASMIQAIAAAAGTSGAEERLFAVSRDGTAATVALTAATKDHAAVAAQEAVVLESLKGVQDSYDAGISASVAGQLAAAKAAQALKDGFAEVANGEKLAGQAAELAAGGLEVAGGGAQGAGAAVASSGNSVRGAYGWWGLLTKEVTLFGGVLGSAHLIGSVQLWHIALDGLFESAVALGEALAALTVGLVAMSYAGQDIYNHLMAVNTVNQALGSSIPPLTGKFHQLGQAMASQTVEAYGGALNLVNQNGTILARVAAQVVTGLDNWIAKLDLWKASQKSTGALLENGVGFLHQFMQALDNVGLAIANLVKADPGTAHYLMDLVVGFTQVLDMITKLPTPILYAALALHSFMLWGGLLTTGLLKLLTPMQAIATAAGGISKANTAVAQLGNEATGLERLKATLTDIGTGFASMGKSVAAWGTGIKTAAQDAQEGEKASAALGAAFGGLQTKITGLLNGFMALAASPWAWAIAGVAFLAAIAVEATQADHATKSFIADMDNGLASMTASQAIPQINTDMGQLNSKIIGVGNSLVQQVGNWHSVGGVMTMVGQLAKSMTGGFTDSLLKMNADVNAFSGEIVKLSSQQTNLFNTMGGLVKAGYSFSQALALMDLAGVKAGDSLDLMRQKVANLITGYQNMGVQSGMLANGVAAVTLATELQNSKIQQLTQSFTTFLGVVTGGESALVTAERGLAGLGAAATGAGTKMTVANGQTRLTTTATGALGAASASTATQIGGLSASSQQLTSTWQTAITNGGNLVNALLTQSAAAGMGAKGYNLVSAAAKDYMQQLLPMAQGNQLATSELYALAQEAGYHGANSFQALSQWIGKTSNAGQDLQSKVTALTTASAGLTNDMNALAQAISGNLNQAMSAAILQANGGQTAFNNFANAAVAAKGTTDGMTASATTLANVLVKTTGNTTQAHQEFDVFSTSLGLSKTQADNLWASVTKTTSAVQGAGNAANTTAGNMNTLGGSLSNVTSQAVAAANALNQVINAAGQAVNAQQALTRTVGVGGILPTPTGGAAGFRVPGGYGGGDVVPAMLEPGETVVPKHLTATVAPLMKAHNVPGFDRGGIMGGGMGTGPLTPGHLTAGWFGGDSGQQPGWGDRDDHRRGGGDRRWGGGDDDDRRMHVHLEMDGREIGNAMVPYSAAAAGRYQLRNSGRATGSWGTGWNN